MERDAMSKFFEVYCRHELESVFIWLTFTVALIICFALYLFRKEKINRYDCICGVVLAVAAIVLLNI